MAMVVIVTRDVPSRFRGFLASCSLEISPSVYTAPDMSRGVRERLWAVLKDWHATLGRGSIIMTWNDKNSPGGQGLAMLNSPPKVLEKYEGLILCKKEIETQ